MLREAIKKKVEEIRVLRSEGNWEETDKIREALRMEGVSVEIERDGSVFWWERFWRNQPFQRGVSLATTIKTARQRWALAHLSERTYEYRKSLFLGKLTIEGDLAFWAKDKLTSIFMEEDKLSGEDEIILERKMRSEGYMPSGVFTLA